MQTQAAESADTTFIPSSFVGPASISGNSRHNRSAPYPYINYPYITVFNNGCITCQRTKPLRQKPLGLLSPNEVPENFWQIISCDFVTDLPSSKGFNAVMVCVDRLSKMVRLIPCHKTISSEVAAKKFRDYVWKDFGLPSRIISDRGPQFVSSFTCALNSLLGITENLSTARHPQTDGQTERMNQEMEQ
jgi:hypothetical protein